MTPLAFSPQISVVELFGKAVGLLLMKTLAVHLHLQTIFLWLQGVGGIFKHLSHILIGMSRVVL